MIFTPFLFLSLSLSLPVNPEHCKRAWRLFRSYSGEKSSNLTTGREQLRPLSWIKLNLSTNCWNPHNKRKSAIFMKTPCQFELLACFECFFFDLLDIFLLCEIHLFTCTVWFSSASQSIDDHINIMVLKELFSNANAIKLFVIVWALRINYILTWVVLNTKTKTKKSNNENSKPFQTNH